MPDCTRREAFAAAVTAGAAGLAGCLGLPRRPTGRPPTGDPPVSRDATTTYPLVTYENVRGEPVVTMPMNVRVDLRDSALGVERVRDVFRYDYRWSPIVSAVDPLWPWHHSPTQWAWDANGREFATPLGDYRRPFPIGVFRGELGHHAYVWTVRESGEVVGAAVQAHVDVGTVLSHVGARYDTAAAAVRGAFRRAGWSVGDGDFDYGVSRRQSERWGETGDTWLYPPDADPR